MPLRAQSGLSGLVTPAVSTLASAGAAGLAGLRVLVGLMWLYNVVWKRPPDFGEDSGTSVYGFSQDAVEYPVFPPYSWLVENLVLPSFPAFGWMVLVVETMLAVLLLTGTLVRLAALVGVAQSLAIGLSVAQTPGEWPWSYWLMIGAHVVLLVTASGRVAAVDSVRAEAAAGRGQPAATRLVRGWVAVLGLTGIVAGVLAIAGDPLASSGEQLGGPGLSVSLGSYNLLGAMVLVVVAALMLVAATVHRREFALAASGLAVLAALSVYVQLTRTDVWLGGSNTSAAFFLCAAVVAGVTAGALTSSSRKEGTATHGSARAT